MADLLRMREMRVRVSERDFPFVVQITVPDGGFECTLGAVNAWRHCNGATQRRRPHYHAGEHEFWGWCFDGLEIAKAVRQRFGGEILPVAVRVRADRRPDRVSQVPDAGRSARVGKPMVAGLSAPTF